MDEGFLFLHTRYSMTYRQYFLQLQHLVNELRDIKEFNNDYFRDLTTFFNRFDRYAVCRYVGNVSSELKEPVRNIPSVLNEIGESYHYNIYPAFMFEVPLCWFVDVLEKKTENGVQIEVEIPDIIKERINIPGSLVPSHLTLIFVNERDGQHTSSLVSTVYSKLVDEMNFSDNIYVSVSDEDSLMLLVIKKLCNFVVKEIDEVLYKNEQIPMSGLKVEGESVDSDYSAARIELIENAFSETLTLKWFVDACRTVDLHHDNKIIGHVGSQPYRVRSHFTLKEIENKLMKLILKQVITEILQKLRCEIFTEAELNQMISDAVTEAEKVPGERNVLNTLFGIRELQTLFDMLSVGFLAVDVNSSEWREKVAKKLFEGTRANAKLRKFIENVQDSCYAEIRKEIKDSNVSTKKKDLDQDEGKSFFDKEQKEKELNICEIKDLKNKYLGILSKIEHDLDRHDMGVYTFEDFKKEKAMRECGRMLVSQHGSEIICCWPAGNCVHEQSVREDVLVVCTKDEARGIPNNLKSPYDSEVYKIIKKFHVEDLEEERLLYEKEKKEKTMMSRDKRIQILNVINKHSKRLMQRHSNLSVIKPSMFLSHRNGHNIEIKPCLVLYCTCKGLIPIGEKEFPKSIGGFDVDIREGYALPCRGPQNYCNPLRMGCSIGRQGIKSAGSIGLFVQEVDSPQKCGFITCCHVLFGMSYTNVLRDFVRESCSSENKYFVVQQSDIDVQESEEMRDVSNSASPHVPRVQNASTTSSLSVGRECGLVRDIFHDKLCSVSLQNHNLHVDVGVDAAYVEITSRILTFLCLLKEICQTTKVEAYVIHL